MKKIMFNDRYGLTEAVLTGRKTMTRRSINFNEELVLEWSSSPALEKAWKAYIIKKYARYKVGETIAVAQCYNSIFDYYYHKPEQINTPEGYKFYEAMRMMEQKGDSLAADSNKMFVRADLMPHHIRITDIKVERLQDITDEDCLKEGVEKWLDSYIATGIMERGGKNNATFATPREAFAALIDRISGKGTWERNPYVFAYTFELVK